MPLIEEVTPGTRSQPPSTKNTTKLDATEPSPNSLDPGIYNSLLNMKMGEMNLPTVEKSLPAGLNFQPQTGAAAPQVSEQITCSSTRCCSTGCSSIRCSSTRCRSTS